MAWLFFDHIHIHRANVWQMLQWEITKRRPLIGGLKFTSNDSAQIIHTHPVWSPGFDDQKPFDLHLKTCLLPNFAQRCILRRFTIIQAAAGQAPRMKALIGGLDEKDLIVIVENNSGGKHLK